MESSPEYKYAEVTEQTIRAALLLELRKLGLTVANEVAIDVLYAGEVVGEYFADLVVNGVVIVEVKATHFEVGLLLNFGPKAEIKRKAFDNAHKGRLTWAAKP